MNKLKASFCSLALMLMCTLQGWAQFNPSNPEEPSINYMVELECTPQDVAGLYGDGQYKDGSYINISTYPYNSNYVFQYWEHDGELYTRSRDFLYRVSTRDAKFIAHYKYTPDNPEEPEAHFMRRLFLKCEPEGVASFNYTSGDKFELGCSVPIYETGRRWEYEFKGWFEGEELVSSSVEFGFTIPDRDVTLVARYEFNPSNPADPSSFYSTSCDLLAESNDLKMGAVAVEGLEKGRAVFGSWVTLRATVYGDNVFWGWYLGDNLLSLNPVFRWKVPSDSDRLYIVGVFKDKSEGDPVGVNDFRADDATVKEYYDLMGRKVDPEMMGKAPYIIRESRNGKEIRTYKMIL